MRPVDEADRATLDQVLGGHGSHGRPRIFHIARKLTPILAFADLRCSAEFRRDRATVPCAPAGTIRIAPSRSSSISATSTMPPARLPPWPRATPAEHPHP